MSRVSKIIIGLSVILFAIISLNRSGGILCAILLIAIGFSANFVNFSIEFYKYRTIKNKSNPLYMKGCYREKNAEKELTKWSNLKLVYWFQIYVLVQDILFLISGTITDITGQWYKVQWLMPLLALLPFPIREGIQSYYEWILKKELKKIEKEIIWKPFDSGKNYYYETVNPSSIETNYYNFKELEMRIFYIFDQKKYVLWKKYLFDFLGEIHLYIKEGELGLNIFMVIDAQKKNL